MMMMITTKKKRPAITLEDKLPVKRVFDMTAGINIVWLPRILWTAYQSMWLFHIQLPCIVERACIYP
jgi:hypothetical protein